MSLSHLRPLELAAATLVSIVILLVAIAPTLASAGRGPAGAAEPRTAASPGIESLLSPEWRLA